MTVPALGPVGIWTGALDTMPLTAALEQVAAFDEQGWGALWYGEAYGREALTAAQLYLGASTRMTVATGIA
ncbi:MAG: LLM class F420-dependent oxidoreductase, partial [Mycobacteriales bacterium]